MSTLLFTLEYPPFHGGIANYYGNLVKHWPEPDHIFVLDNNQGQLINSRWPILKWLQAFWQLRKAVKNNHVKHIIVGQILPLGTVSLLYCWFANLNYSVVLHGLDFTSAIRGRRKRILAKMILSRAKKIICASSYTAELVKKFLPTIDAGKIATVNPGVEKNYELKTRPLRFAKRVGRVTNYEFFKDKYNLSGKIILLSVGRLVKRKGFDKVIEAMPRVLEKVPNLVYVILGSGEELKNFQFSIFNFQLQNNIIIINNAGDDERDSWYNICDIFIMPTRNINGDFEGFGIVYLEANLAGKPVIAGRSGGAGEAVVDGLNGLLVDGEKTEEISQVIVRLAQDANLRHKLGQQGRERAVREFNWEKQTKKVYQAVQGDML